MVMNIKKYVIIKFSIEFFMKSISKKLLKIHYLHLMIKGIIKRILKVKLGIEDYNFQYVLVSVFILESDTIV